jgi:uncharacterized protein (DUF3084 family)
VKARTSKRLSGAPSVLAPRGGSGQRALLLLVALLVGVGCSAPAAQTARSEPSAIPAASTDDPERLLPVDCLLPGQVRRLGSKLTYLTPRRATKTSAIECEIRGGEYVAYDRSDYRTALRVWQPQAEEGDPEAQNYVGETYERGLGVAPDYTLAAEWYRRAADQGYGPAQINLGHLYEKGLGVPQDIARAIAFYRSASGLGDADLPFVAEVPAAVAALQLELSSSREESESLRVEVRRLGDELDGARREKAKLESEVATARAALTLERDALREQLDALAGERDTLDVDREGLVGRRAELEGETSALRAQREGLEAEAAKLAAESERIGAQSAELEREEARLEERSVRLAGERARLESERERLGSAGSSESDAHAQERQRLEEERKGLDELAESLEREKRKIAKQDDSLERARNELDERDRDLKRKRDELKVLAGSLGRERTELEDRESELTSRARKLDDRSESLDEQAAAMKDRAREIEAREKKLADREQEVERLRAEADRLARDAEEQQARIAEIASAREAELPGPVIHVIDPPLPLQRGEPRIVVAPDATERVLVGRVEAPAGLLTLTVNDIEIEPTENGVFTRTMALQGRDVAVRIVAVDSQGKRADTRFELAASGAGDTVADAARGKPKKPELKVDFGEYHALLIGNDRYQNLPKLDTAVTDIRAVEDVLVKRYGFEVHTLQNANRYQILSALNEQRAKLGEDDNLLIYYAGHGELDRVNMRGHWLPVDAERESTANWISNVTITDILKSMNARHVMVIADSCYSGALTRSALARLEAGMNETARVKWIEKMMSKRSRTALTSGGLKPVMDGGGGRHSIFAKAFIDVLTRNEAVLEGQRLFSELSSLVSWAAEAERFEQVPEYAPIQYSGHESGDFFFVPRG